MTRACFKTKAESARLRKLSISSTNHCRTSNQRQAIFLGFGQAASRLIRPRCLKPAPAMVKAPLPEWVSHSWWALLKRSRTAGVHFKPKHLSAQRRHRHPEQSPVFWKYSAILAPVSSLASREVAMLRPLLWILVSGNSAHSSGNPAKEFARLRPRGRKCGSIGRPRGIMNETASVQN